MRVDPTTALQSALLGLLKGGARAPSPPVFAPEGMAVAAPVPPAVSTVQASGSVAMLVALAAQAPGLTRGQAIKRADGGLSALGRLHRALRSGTMPADALAELRQWTQEQHGEEGPLGELMRDIELRILVELAKAERG